MKRPQFSAARKIMTKSKEFKFQHGTCGISCFIVEIEVLAPKSAE